MLLGVVRIDCCERLHLPEGTAEQPCGFAEPALALERNSEILVRIEDLHAPLEIVRLNRDHLTGKTLVFAIGGLRPVDLAPPARELTDPEDILGVIEQPLRVVRVTANGLRGASHRLSISRVAAS